MGEKHKTNLGIQAITRPMSHENCYLQVLNPAGLVRDADDALADTLNTLNRANLKGLAIVTSGMNW